MRFVEVINQDIIFKRVIFMIFKATQWRKQGRFFSHAVEFVRFSTTCMVSYNDSLKASCMNSKEEQSDLEILRWRSNIFVSKLPSHS